MFFIQLNPAIDATLTMAPPSQIFFSRASVKFCKPKKLTSITFDGSRVPGTPAILSRTSIRSSGRDSKASAIEFGSAKSHAI